MLPLFKVHTMKPNMQAVQAMTPINTPINTMTGWHPILRPIGRVLVIAQLALVLQPLSVLAQEKGQAPFNPAAQSQLQRLGQWSQAMEKAKAQGDKDKASLPDQVSDHLKQAHEIIKGLSNTSSSTTRRIAVSTSQRDDQIAQLKTHLNYIDQGTASVRAEFAATKAELKAKNLPAEILARHDEAANQFEQRSAAFATIASKISNKTGAQDSDLNDLAAFFDRYPTSRKPATLVPGKLPWSTPKPSTRAPATTKTAWYQNFYADQKIQMAQAGGTSIGPLQFNIPPIPTQAPTVADLAQTDEVQLTAAIRAKAVELANNPVTIYNWVRNNIEYAPTAGAIQSAQDTLDKKRGNATDTASLLIALLRAANIPARYQYGTVDIAADKVQNWVGGATKPEAALQILNQGGIAATGMASGGRITTIRMEHVWVNAYTNWTPSRGNRNATASQHPNPNGNLNAWVPLDASFKQYSYSAGMDLKTAVPLDANGLLTAAQQGATVNAAQGWVQNLNQAAIQSQLTAYQTRLQAYSDASPTGPNGKVGDVIGRKIIPQQAQPLLAGTLQNIVVMQGQEVTAVPANLQHKFSYKLFASQTDQANGSPILEFTEKTSKLVGKRLTLTYVPATQADADTIASYLPRPHTDGSPTQPSELPTSLPGYLIKLKPQINLDGQVVASSSIGVQMGTDLYSTGGFTQLYDASQWDLTNEESNVAGNATAIGISAGGISGMQIAALKDRLTSAQTKLQAKDVTGLTGEQLSGDVLTATIWSWFAAAETHSRLSRNQAGMIENPGLSYGLFHAVANPYYSWGTIRKVTFPGVNIDIGHVRNLTWAKDNSAQSWVTYNRAHGQYMSALEHAILEKLFNNSTQCNPVGAATPTAGLPVCPQGMSAVKAIATGAQSGQKVFTIAAQVYQDNPSIVTASLAAHSQSTKERVQQALDAGYEVTIHEAPITQDGWTGAGFTLIDPATGAGGYIIDGGSNGGWIGLAVAAIVLGIGIYLMLLPVFIGLTAFLPLILTLLLGVLLLELNIALAEEGTVSRNFFSNLAYSIISFAVMGLLFPATAVAIPAVAIATVITMLVFSFLNAVHAKNFFFQERYKSAYA
jgi:transglutaminase-like putative cysteine protease